MSGPLSSGSSSSRSGDSSLLYSEWKTINVKDICELNSKSVLYKLRNNINGQGVVDSVVKSFVVGFNTTGTPQPMQEQQQQLSNRASQTFLQQQSYHPSFEYLQTDRDVQWVMEVICYGLSLPITTSDQHEGVRDCVKIYCEWMFAVLPASKTTDKLIPFPIRDDANRYFRLMIQHLFNVFVRRNANSSSNSNVEAVQQTNLASSHRNSVLNLNRDNNSSSKLSEGTSQQQSSHQEVNWSDVTSRQAVLCHRILRTLETICSDDTNQLDSESWENILTFLLAINDVLLSGPVDKEDIGTNLCERIVKSLFELWLISCHRSFPSPSFWKTFHELCLKIRHHRTPVIDHWSLVVHCVTQRLVQLSFWTSNVANASSSSTSSGIESNLGTSGSTSSSFPVLSLMNYDIVSQAWFRFLHILGNPVDLSCLDSMQHQKGDQVGGENFKRAMRGVSLVVNTFLGTVPVESVTASASVSSFTPTLTQASPSVPRRSSATSNSSSSTSTTKLSSASSTSKAHLPFLQTLAGRGSSSSSVQSSHHHKHESSQGPNSNNPPVISLPTASTAGSSSSSSFPSVASNMKLSPARPKVNSVLTSLGNWLFSASLLGTELFRPQTEPIKSGEDEVQLRVRGSTTVDYEAGQSEAVGVLCRLISSKRSDEDISPVYLARFYLVIQNGLNLSAKKPRVMMSILMNSTRLFQLDLNGVNILIPHFLQALEWFMVSNDSKTTLSVIANGYALSIFAFLKTILTLL